MEACPADFTLREWFAQRGAGILSCNENWRVPKPVYELALCMANGYQEASSLISCLRFALCNPNVSQRFSFRYPLAAGKNHQAALRIARMLRDAGCFTAFRESKSCLAGRISAAPRVTQFICGIHAEVFSHVIARRAAQLAADRVGADWEVLSNVKLCFGDMTAEFDEVIRVGRKVFVMETKTLSQNVDYAHFHEAGGRLTLNDPSHLIYLQLRADEEQLELLTYFHGFYAANAATCERTIERCILDAFAADAVRCAA